jgi:hypothetical protein
MDALQADASTIPDDSVDHVANALVNMRVTAPAAATVPASAIAAPSAAAIIPASTLVDIAETSATAFRARDSTSQDKKMSDALESILHRLEALESPSRSYVSPPSSPSGLSSCASPSIAVKVLVISLSASRRRFKTEITPPSLKGCMERPDEYERAVKHWALLEADERNKNALPPDLWVFSLRQAAIEGGVSVRFQSLVTMELAVTDAMWHGHAGVDKWIGLVWTESKIDQNKIASDVASKLNQRRPPGESIESWHKDTLHLLEQHRRTTSVAYPPAIAVDTLLTRLNLSPGAYAADKVLLCRAATVPAESTLLTEVNRAIASIYPLFATYEHSDLANPTFPPRRRTITGGSLSQSPAVRGPSRTFSTYNFRASVHR